MTGDWGGLRTTLKDKGYDFTLDYSPVVVTNVSGGYNRNKTVRYSDQFTYGINLDLQKIANINGGQVKLSLIDRNGKDLAQDRIQDPRTAMIGSDPQSNYGRGQTWHIAQLWYRQFLFDKRLDVKIGRMPIGEDFDNDGCYFQNLALCGSLAGHGSAVWYNTPVSQWGARIRYNVTAESYFQTGAFLYNPSYLTRQGSFKLDLSGYKGNMYAAEVGWQPSVGLLGLPGSYKLGSWYNTADAADVLKDEQGNDYVLSHKSARMHDGKYGAYLYLRQQVLTVGGNVNRGLSVFGHIAVNDKATATMDYQTQVGVIFKGPFARRPQDFIGLGTSKMHINSRVSQREILKNESKQLYDESNPLYQPVQDAEYATELHYSAAITPWFTLRPNIQWLVHPGGNASVKAAWVAGAQVMLSF